MSDANFLKDMEAKAEAFFHQMEEEVKAAVHPEAAHDAAEPMPVVAGSADAASAADVHAEDAAPSSTEPVASAPVVDEQASTVAPEVEQPGESVTAGVALTQQTHTSTSEPAAPAEDHPSSPPSTGSAASISAGDDAAWLAAADAARAEGHATPEEVAALVAKLEVPNVAPAVEEPTTAPVSAPSAGGADTTSPSAASSPAETVKLTPEESLHFEAVMAEPPAPNESLQGAMAVVAPKTFEQMVEERFQFLEAAFMKLPSSIAAIMSEGSKTPEEFAAAVHAHVFKQ